MIEQEIKIKGRPKSKLNNTYNFDDNSAKQGWNIKNIPFETRVMAKKAANKMSMTIGEWINEIVIQEAQKILSHKANIDIIDPNKNIFSEQIEEFTKKYDSQMEILTKTITMLAEKQNRSLFEKVFGKK